MILDKIPVFTTPTGIFVSGGADSALLLFLLLKKYTSPLQIFTIVKYENIDNYAKTISALNVVRKCIELTNNDNIEHRMLHVYTHEIPYLYWHNIVESYTQRKIVDKVFHGLTANPPDDVVSMFKHKQHPDDVYERNPNIIKDIQSINSPFVYPWINVNKKFIYDQYKDLELLDSLFPLTLSCVRPTVNLTHCGECFWCEERKWAFGKIE